MSLHSIVQALGGDLYAGGRRANVPAPGHSAADRSVSLLLSGGRVVVHSFGAADWREVLDDLRGRGLVDAAGAPASGASAALSDRPEPLRGERLAAARALWSEGRGIPAGGECARHLSRRRIAPPWPGADSLRRHPHAPLSVYRPGRSARAALMAAITDPEDDLSAVELTYLDPGGLRAAGLRTARKTVGLMPPACAVRLHPVGSELLVAEGVFTTLSASARFGLPGWALLCTRNLRSWTPPFGVRRVVIAADRGEDGFRSAAVLAARLRSAGLGARVRPPPAPYGDWNDWAQAQAEDGGGGRKGEAGRAGPGG